MSTLQGIDGYGNGIKIYIGACECEGENIYSNNL